MVRQRSDSVNKPAGSQSYSFYTTSDQAETCGKADYSHSTTGVDFLQGHGPRDFIMILFSASFFFYSKA